MKYPTLKIASEKSGIADSTLRGWADGQHIWTIASAERAARIFGVPIDEWIAGMSQPMPDIDDTEYGAAQ